MRKLRKAFWTTYGVGLLVGVISIYAGALLPSKFLLFAIALLLLGLYYFEKEEK